MYLQGVSERFHESDGRIHSAMKIIHAETEEQLETIRILFLEYAATLPFDLGFQGFEEELAGLPGCYAHPEGNVLLGFVDEEPAGCVAFRKIDEGVSEMKRLWVRTQFRGRGFGRLLAEAAIVHAAETGYHVMRLDTLSSLVDAVSLYRKLGFQEIDPYTHNPMPGVIFMEKNLASVPEF